MEADAKRLLKLLGDLDDKGRETLMDFAEFLVAKRGSVGSTAIAKQQTTVPEPTPLDRPERETVIGAIKRLSKSYPMVDKAKMLHQVSGLMTQHMVQGRDAVEVIDELEVVFARHYERLRGEGEAE